MNPIYKIEETKNYKLSLYTTYDMYTDMESINMGSLIDDIEKHVVFTDTDNDFELLDLSLQNVRVLMECELEEMRTITHPNKTEQDVCFIISNVLNVDRKLIGEIPIGRRTLYPKILIYNGETNGATLFFYVENKDKTRRKKLEKIIGKKNVSI